MRQLSILLSVSLLSSLCSQCATSNQSTIFGASIGGIVGGGLGAASGQNQNKPREGAVIGMAVGAAIGGLLGFLKHQEKETQSRLNVLAPSPMDPQLTKPQVEKIWVQPRVDNNRFIEGHYQFIIGQPSRWVPANSDPTPKKSRQK